LTAMLIANAWLDRAPTPQGSISSPTLAKNYQ
jgi:hypothetical protein